jgi:serine/threonine protein kinase/WD40 repeat protein/tetratricopeptide (TPR) repeat protein
MNEESLFHRALQEPAEQRAAFLERACSGNEALRRRLEALLQAHANPGSFLAGRPGDPAATSAPGPDCLPTEGPGSRVGPYKLLQPLGEGGMGAVWMAEQTQPVRRRVALKIIKPGMDSAQVIARFEAERQALALMDHPNIARVLDAGTTQSGRPYFVMELVKGVPITRYCDEHHLTPKQRLELFVPVCSAVQHAHQKGIIHRDIKPSNILIARYDGQAVAKVIDFGIAKATGPRLTERTLFTEFGQVVGTLEYMSPEQAELNQLDIDTRSDIYSLGVLLYELLTGTTPLERKRLKGVALLEVLRLIREEEPPKPSTRLSTTEELPSIAAQRGLEPRRLSGLVRGELDWIVMKCLEKERSRRYETANALALDLQRYLADEPVLACPPSTGYRLRKFARRNRRALASVTLAGLSLLALAAGATVYGVGQKDLADKREKFGHEVEQKLEEVKVGKERAEAKLYRALVGQAAALRGAHQPGYRRQVWQSLRQAVALNTPAKDQGEIRREVLACLGDPIGLDPVPTPSAKRTEAEGLFWRDAPEPVQRVLNEHNRGLRRGNISAGSAAARLLALAGPGLPLSLVGPDGKVRIRTTPPLGLIHSLRFTADGRLLIAGCAEGILIWSTPDLSLRTFIRGSPVSSLAVDPGGVRLATLGSGRVELWSLISGRQIGSFPVGADILSIAFSADRKYLLAVRQSLRGGSGGHVRSFARDEGGSVRWAMGSRENAVGWVVDRTPEKHYLEGHRGGVAGLAFSPDGKTLVSVSKDRTVRVWDAASGSLLRHWSGDGAEFAAVALAPDGRLLATADAGGQLRLWDYQSGKRLAAGLHHGWVERLQFAAGGRLLFAAGADGVSCHRVAAPPNVALEPVRGIRLEPTADRGGRPIRARALDLAVHPDGSRLALLGHFPTALFWCDLARAGSAEALAPLPSATAASLHLDRTGRRLWFADARGAIATWDCGQGRLLGRTSRTFARPKLAVTADGRWAASLHPTDQVLTLHDLEKDRELLTLPPEGSVVWSFAWSPDGRQLAVGRADGVVALWRLEEVRARLAEFGIAVPSTAVRGPLPAPPTLAPAALERIVGLNRAREEGERYEVAARWLWQADRLKEAEAAARHCPAVFARRAADLPEAVAQRGAARGHFALGLILQDTGRLNEAMEAYRRSAATARQVLGRAGGDRESREVLATALQNLGVVCQDLGRFPEAERAFRDSLDLQDKLVGTSIDEERLKRLGWTVNHLAGLLLRQEKSAEARRLLQGAIRRQRDFLLRHRQEVPSFSLLASLEALVKTHFRLELDLGNHAAAVAALRARTDFGVHTMSTGQASMRLHFTLGWVLEGIAAAERDPKRSAAQRRAAAQGYIDFFKDVLKRSNDFAETMERIGSGAPFIKPTITRVLAEYGSDLRLVDPGRNLQLAREAAARDKKRDSAASLGKACYRAGAWKEALPHLQKWAETAKGDAAYSAKFYLAMNQARLGNKDEARKCYAEATRTLEGRTWTMPDLLRLWAKAAEVVGVPAPPESQSAPAGGPLLPGPALESPAPGAILEEDGIFGGTPLVRHFTWSAVRGASRYQLRLRRGESRTSNAFVVDIVGLGSPSFVGPGPRRFIGPHSPARWGWRGDEWAWHWQVRALVKEKWTAWSTERTFRIGRKRAEAVVRQEMALREAIRRNSKDAAAHNNLSDFLMRQDRLAAAEAEAREAIRLKPDLAVAHCTLGEVLYRRGKRAEGEAAFQEACRLQPTSAILPFTAGDTYARFGQWDRASAAYRRGLELVPQSHWRWYQAAVLYLKAGKTAEYRQACREMVERFGKDSRPEFAERTAKTCLLLPDGAGQLKAALALAERAVRGTEKHQSYWYFQFVRALAEYRAGRHAAAIDWLKRVAPQEDRPDAATFAPFDAAAFAVLALAQHRLGRAEEARAALARARALVARHQPDPARGRPFTSNWPDWLRCGVLVAEAEELLKKPASNNP